MAGWTQHKGKAVHLPLANVDTDQLIPARFMSTPRSAGYADYLMHDLRRDAVGGLRVDFPLNTAPKASVLIAGQNFGSGSSREAAVYALVDAGFRAIIAPSFGDIFASNAVNNGLCPAQVDQTEIDALLAAGATEVTVDLEARKLRAGATQLPFHLDSSWAQKLMNGWDDIDLTRQHGRAISSFRAERAGRPGTWPA